MLTRRNSTVLIGSAFVALVGVAVFGLPQVQTRVSPHEIANSTPLNSEQTYICDFGIVSPKSITEKTFTVTNDSGVELNNPKFDSSCACSQSSISSSVIPPKGTAEVTIRFRAGKELGKIDQQIRIRFSQPRVFAFRLTGRIAPWADRQPDSLTVGPLDVGAIKSYSISLDCTRSKARKVSAKSLSDWLTIEPGEVEITSPEQRLIRYLVTVNTTTVKNKSGRLSGVLQFSSDDESEPVLQTSVNAIVTPEVIAEPERIFVSSIRPGASRTDKISISGPLVKQVGLAPSARVSDAISEYVSCVVSSSEREQFVATICTTIPKDQKEAFLNGFVEVVVEDGRGLQIPISIRIEP